ncbi:hypothetical protein [Hymenobacter negativus]|nr:hypothetical protein [Hymenobacter negativus]
MSGQSGAKPPKSPAVAPRPAAASRPEQLDVMAVGDSIGPRPMEASRVGTAQLRAELAEEYTTADTITGRFLVVKPLSETPRVLYRASQRDTVWTELDGLLNRYEHGDQQLGVEIRQANLDGQGRPEMLIHFYSAIYGSGGGTTYASDYVIDISSSPPQLLLQANTRYIDEAFPAYAAMHGEPLKAGEAEQGYERSIKLQGRELLVGPIEAIGLNPELGDRKALTQLPAGRYRYQRGQVLRIR